MRRLTSIACLFPHLETSIRGIWSERAQKTLEKIYISAAQPNHVLQGHVSAVNSCGHTRFLLVSSPGLSRNLKSWSIWRSQNIQGLRPCQSEGHLAQHSTKSAREVLWVGLLSRWLKMPIYRRSVCMLWFMELSLTLSAESDFSPPCVHVRTHSTFVAATTHVCCPSFVKRYERWVTRSSSKQRGN